jgi:hypothetical protein
MQAAPQHLQRQHRASRGATGPQKNNTLAHQATDIFLEAFGQAIAVRVVPYDFPFAEN